MGDISYSARMYKSEAVRESVEDDIKKLAYVVLDYRDLNITKCQQEEGYDPYPYCDQDYCPYKDEYIYRGYIKPGGYTVYGNTKTEIYWKIVKMFAIQPQMNIPMLR